MLSLDREEACFLTQCMIIARSHEVSGEAKLKRRNLAAKLEEIWPGILKENFGQILVE